MALARYNYPPTSTSGRVLDLRRRWSGGTSGEDPWEESGLIAGHAFLAERLCGILAVLQAPKTPK